MRVTQVLTNFIKSESFGGIFLAISTIMALCVANSPLKHLYHSFFEANFGFHLGHYYINMPIEQWINDVLMSFFFLLVGLEIKREMLFGELNSFSKAAFPSIAALGGMIVPGLIYYSLNAGTDSSHGFGIPMATDIAFALGVMLILGKRIPIALKVFLVTLAVVDDLGAIVVIALFYSTTIHFVWLFAAAFVVVILIICNVLGIKHLIVYLGLGVVLWLFVHTSGIHATIAAVVLAFCIPVKAKQNFTDFQHQLNSWSKLQANIKQGDSVLLNADKLELLHKIQQSTVNAQNPLLRLEHFLQPWSAYFIMPLFAFANAGISIQSNFNFHIDHIFLGVFLGLVVGKPIGIFCTCFICEKIGIAKRPTGVSWVYILGAGMLAGIGFTMSIFVSGLAFDTQEAKELSKITILLASLTSCIVGMVFLLFAGKMNGKK